MSVWGDAETKFFFDLTPSKVLDAIERSTGQRCTGRVLALNSMENRVYEVEMEDAPTLVAKFYRPGRWSKEIILDEHAFMLDLETDEIPVIAPIKFLDGQTLHQEQNLWYTVFPKFKGKSPDELNGDQLAQVGRLIARMHNVGASKKSDHRLVLSPHTYGIQNLKFLVDTSAISKTVEERYKKTVEEICALSEPLFAKTKTHRLHGDCHFGNLLWGKEGLFFVDFDDMVTGPAVQDLWLVIPGRDDYAKRQMQDLLEGYEMMRPFDRSQLKLVEPLRALRFVHFSAWIARRYKDPAFTRAFPNFGTERYWAEQLADLQEQLGLISSGS